MVTIEKEFESREEFMFWHLSHIKDVGLRDIIARTGGSELFNHIRIHSIYELVELVDGKIRIVGIREIDNKRVEFI